MGKLALENSLKMMLNNSEKRYLFVKDLKKKLILKYLDQGRE